MMSSSVNSWNNATALELDSTSEILQPVLRLFGALLQPREVVELRVLGANTRLANPIANGYFDDPLALAQAATSLRSKSSLLYFTVNPVRRDLLYAAENHFRRPAGWSPINRDMTRRCALVIKFDPVLTPEMGTHGPIHQTAFERAGVCRDFLSEQGWPLPAVARSGSSVHLLYAIDLANKPQSDELMLNILQALDKRFSDNTSRIDTSAFNAVLWCPLYGMPAHQTGEFDAPYPQSTILHIPAPLQLVVPELMEASSTWPVSFQPVRVDGNPVEQFVANCCVLEPAAWTPTSTLYAAYGTFCEQNNLPVLPTPHFTRALAARLGLEGIRRKVHRVVTRGVKGIKLQERWASTRR